jgi:hypothetical protein
VWFEVFFFDNLPTKVSKKEKAALKTLYRGVDIIQLVMGVGVVADMTLC